MTHQAIGARRPGGRHQTGTLDTVERPPDWMAEGACVGHPHPEDFYPTDANKTAAAHALAVCKTCPVSRQCLLFALEHKEQGVWGGATQWERSNIKRRPGWRARIENRVG